MSRENSLVELVERSFVAAGIAPMSVQAKSFPGETIIVVEVEGDVQRALAVARGLDGQIDNGFVTIRQVKPVGAKTVGTAKNVHSNQVAVLLQYLSARSRTSENQPSLRYVKDVEERLNLAVSPRHHLIFGRRGVGKTSLLLEAKRVLEEGGAFVMWVNMHPLRGLNAAQAFFTVLIRVCDLALGAYQTGGTSAGGVELMKSVRIRAEECVFNANGSATQQASSLVPLMQHALARFLLEAGRSIYIFLDDIHYLPSAQVPLFLDLLHGITRDNPAWLKVAGIQHQTRWFIPNPPTGLQTGHDAAIINLDITLEHPEKAKEFLQDVLRGYLEESGATPMGNVLSSAALDRLVLASGGVPRDFLTLCASSIQTARQRDKAQTVGVQDVNNAAGIAGQTKLQELEDDAAATSGRSAALVGALNQIREFLLTTEQITFFRVDFRDKETHAGEYRLLQALADLRMLHLINGSLSDPHHAGQRSEVYLLDLSQYSGYRLKQRIRVLDFERGHIVLKRTRSTDAPKVGDTVLKLVSLLRSGPVFSLTQLTADQLFVTDV